MHDNLLLNKVLVAAALFALAFCGLISFFPLEALIITLNGIFAGTMAAVLVAYFSLLKNAILGVQPYDRVRQMTLGFFFCWTAYCLSVAASIYVRAAGVDVHPTVMTAASRYVAIIAAILQVTAPDFGLGLFHGRDRKILAGGAATGLVVALFAIYAQQMSILP
jgi:hypothetical protein